MNQGKLSLAAWRVFQTEFRILVQRLEQPSEEELHNLAMEATPEQTQRACVREQERRNQENPVMKITGLNGVPGVDDLTRDVVNELVAVTVG